MSLLNLYELASDVSFIVIEVGPLDAETTTTTSLATAALLFLSRAPTGPHFRKLAHAYTQISWLHPRF